MESAPLDETTKGFERMHAFLAMTPSKRPGLPPDLPPVLMGYHAELDAASALSRTRRTLREARLSLAAQVTLNGVSGVDVMIRVAVARGDCYPAIDGLDEGGVRRELGKLPVWKAIDVLDDSLSRLDGLVADIAEAGTTASHATLAAGEVDARLCKALVEANRRLRACDAGAYDALRTAARRLSALARTDIQSLGVRLGLESRTRHLVGVIGSRETAAPLGTVAYALFTLEALVYRFAKRDPA